MHARDAGLTRVLAGVALASALAGCPAKDSTATADTTDSADTGGVVTASATNATTMMATEDGGAESTDGGVTTGPDPTDATGSTTDTTATTSDTTGPPPTCGNNVLEAGEECDLTQLDGQDCLSLGNDSGVLLCNLDCTYNTSGCGVCGNDVIDEAEACDGVDVAKEDCVTQGFVGGVLSCVPDCSALDTSMCSVVATCGNDLIEIPEECDGVELNGEDCVSLGFAGGGTLACVADCSGYDITACMGMGGDCCSANGTAGCDNALCEAAVCAIDSFCCSVTWDGLCADEAQVEPACVGVGGSCPP
jgi:hypothetical protein